MRRLVQYAVAGATTLSWIHAECTKYRRFSPLPGMRGVNVRRPDLLPFFPSEEGGWVGPDVDDSVGSGEAMAGKTDPARAMAALSGNGGGNFGGSVAGGRVAAMQLLI
jgi:hypothetical protein